MPKVPLVIPYWDCLLVLFCSIVGNLQAIDLTSCHLYSRLFSVCYWASKYILHQIYCIWVYITYTHPKNHVVILQLKLYGMVNSEKQLFKFLLRWLNVWKQSEWIHRKNSLQKNGLPEVKNVRAVDEEWSEISHTKFIFYWFLCIWWSPKFVFFLNASTTCLRK